MYASIEPRTAKIPVNCLVTANLTVFHNPTSRILRTIWILRGINIYHYVVHLDSLDCQRYNLRFYASLLTVIL